MPKKLIHYNPNEAGALHCDECGHDEGKQPFTTDLIGKRCPKCGADMLTVGDYLKTKKLFAKIDWLNKWFGWLGRERTVGEYKVIGVKIHGNTTTIVDRGIHKDN